MSIASKINENYDTNIRVGGVSIGANGSVSLKSFFIADHHSRHTIFLKTSKPIYTVLING